MSSIETRRVRTADAAKELGCTVKYMQEKMKKGEMDIGKVFKPSHPRGNYCYHVYRDKLDKYLGIEKQEI